MPAFLESDLARESKATPLGPFLEQLEASGDTTSGWKFGESPEWRAKDRDSVGGVRDGDILPGPSPWRETEKKLRKAFCGSILRAKVSMEIRKYKTGRKE